MTYYPPSQYPQTPPGLQQKGVGGFGIAAVIVGILAAIFSWIPFCGIVAYPIAGIGLFVAVVGIIVAISGQRTRMTLSVVGGVICLLAIGMQTASIAYMMYLTRQTAARQQAAAAAAATQPTTAASETDDSDYHQLIKGETAALRSSTGQIAVARTADDFTRYENLRTLNDLDGMRQMISEGRVFLVQSSTRVRVLDPDLFFPVVQILNGPHSGKSGIVDHARIGNVTATPPVTGRDF